MPQFLSLYSNARASFCPRSTDRNIQKCTFVFTPSTSPAVTSCGFCGNSRRILLFGAHSLLKDMAAVNSSVGFKEELDTVTQGKTHPAALRGPGQHVRGCSASGWEADSSRWKASVSTAVDRCSLGWKLGLAAVRMTGVLGARSVWGAHPVPPQRTPLALPWYQ